jgi:predicted permease
MIAKILSITLPIFAIVFAGFVYGKFKKPVMIGANQIVIDLALPCLIFVSLSAKQFDLKSASDFVLISILIMLLSGLLALPLARFSGTNTKALLPVVMFGNVGPIGIPLTFLAFGQEGLAPAVLLLVFSNVLQFSVGVGIMSGRINAKLIYASPLVWATIGGVLFSTLEISLPGWLDISLSMVGNILVPLALLSLGTRLVESKVEHLKVGVTGAIIVTLSRLLVTYTLIAVIPLEPIQRGALILFAGLPPAIFNYMIADRHNQEPDKVASIIIVSHVFSLVVLPLVLWLAL